MEYGKHEEYDEIIGTKSKQLVLDFFRDHRDGKFSAKDINEKTKIPEASLSRTLNDLETMGFLVSKHSGKFKYYTIKKDVWEMIDHMFGYLDQMKQFTLEQRKKKKV